MKFFRDKFNNSIAYLEESKTPYIFYILSFLAATLICTFFEQFTDKSFLSIDLVSHLTLSYIFVLLAVVITIGIITKHDILKILRSFSSLFIILCLRPILNFILSKGEGFNISYLLPGIHDDLTLRYFTFFGDFPDIGVALGNKIVLLCSLIFIFFYSKKHCSWLKSLFTTLAVYTVFFIYAASPFVIKTLAQAFGHLYRYSNELYSLYYLSLIPILLLFFFYLYKKEYFTAFIKDLRPIRLTICLLLYLLGINIAMKSELIAESNIVAFFKTIISFYTIIIATVFSILINNFNDLKIDLISNPQRPLCQESIPEHVYKILCLILGLMTTVYLMLTIEYLGFLIFFYVSAYFIYSCQPLRLKRFFPLSKILLASNAFIIVLSGYAIIKGEYTSFSPLAAFIAILILSLTMNIIDLKDYEGDKAEGIATLPVIFGMKKGQLIVAVFYLLTYLLMSLVAWSISDFKSLSFFVICGITQTWLISKNNFSEKPVLLIYAITLIKIIRMVYLF